jgi:hypothetical protein
MATEQALASATAMGKRRGEQFRDTGLPAANPFVKPEVKDLGQAWRRAYFQALDAHLPAKRPTPASEPAE